MRRYLVPLLALVLLTGICFWAGCSIDGNTGSSAGAEAGKEKAQSGQQAEGWEQKYPTAPTLADLGIPEYPVSELDAGKSTFNWKEGSKTETIVYDAHQCPVTNVAAFFRDALKDMQDLKEHESGGIVTFKFKTADGVPVMIDIMPQDPGNPGGPSSIYIYVNP